MTRANPEVSVRGVFRPLRHAEFRWLVGGQMLSTFGDMLLVVALPFVVLRHGDAADLTAMLTALGIARMAGSPLGGWLADRWQPRTVMLFADGARAVVLAGLVVMVSGDGFDLLHFGIGVVLLGTLDGVFLPAYWAVLPALVAEDELAAGNAIGEGLLVFTVMAGTFVGGLASAVLSPTVVLAVDAATFAVSAGMLLFLRSRPGVRTDEGTGGLWAFVKGSKLFLSITLIAGVLHLASAGTMNVALPVLADERSADGQQVFGVLLGTQGAGLLVGTLIAGLLWGFARRGLAAVALLVVHGAVLIVFPQLPGPVAPMAAMFVLGVVAGVLSILAVTILQQISPPEVRGRVMAVFSAVTLGAYPLSAVLVGTVVVGAGAPVAFLVSGVGVLVTAAIGFGQRALRQA
ncbi:Predicted arabinose efflux permease, MFS family [Lentzea waywayandensis]|uniref:Predicted arabinose efflux permease, MFS family n=1 Tax=Lentzea waywayandensis TaxID=84724 RepID=A0A1I6FGR5_9PSEU|nr:MFS transporter [Lentzea waywayandensis]SFR29115.1 Predicted arabinose efflux permease, MFS family [Lentzea waywayandensis]